MEILDFDLEYIAGFDTYDNEHEDCFQDEEKTVVIPRETNRELVFGKNQ